VLKRERSVKAVRATVRGDTSSPKAVVAQARKLGVTGWVRAADGGELQLHAEGPSEAVDELLRFVDSDHVEPAKVEGHEQFAVRGVSAGVFVVQEHQATAHHWDFRLEVDGVMRSWAVPKGPSMDPAVKRLAVQVPDHDVGHNDFEGASGRGGVIVWDRGSYEQGGRVPWPEALKRGHAVFVLHGEKLEGGFVLQCAFPEESAQWLLVKRRDEEARPGSDIVSDRPESVVSGRTLEQLLDDVEKPAER
jgi:DNA ligase D-like protein (predicted 3'-phosphoesterase)